METHSSPSVVQVDIIHGGVLVTFDDGRCALFPASLLYATLPQAEDFTKPVPMAIPEQ